MTTSHRHPRSRCRPSRGATRLRGAGLGPGPDERTPGPAPRGARSGEAHAQDWVRSAADIKELDPSSPLVGEEWMTGPYAVARPRHSPRRDASQRSRRQPKPRRLPVRHRARRPGGRSGVAAHHLRPAAAQRLQGRGLDAAGRHRRADRRGGPASPSATRPRPAASGWCSAPATSPRSLRWTCSTSCSPTTGSSCSSSTRSPTRCCRVRTGLRAADRPAAWCDRHRRRRRRRLAGAPPRHRRSAHDRQRGDARRDRLGPGEEGAARKAAGPPRLEKPITSELGGVSPIIVVPGSGQADLRFQAEHVATQRLHNGGFNCIAAQVVVLSSDWAQKDAFLDRLRAALGARARAPGLVPGQRRRGCRARALYPGAEAARRHAGGPAHRPRPRRRRRAGLHARVLRPGARRGRAARHRAAFLDAAVDAVNQRLAARSAPTSSPIPRPLARSAPALRGRDRRAALRHGSRSTPGPASATSRRAPPGARSPATPWTTSRAASASSTTPCCSTTPSARSCAGRSGRCPARCSTASSPICPSRRGSSTNRTAATTGRRLTAFAADPSWSALPGIFASALRG